MTEDIKLSSSVTIKRYLELKDRKDREGIAAFVQERFSERYIAPLRNPRKHGFCIMAVCCLMIEALESFWNGWRDTRGRSREAFCSFFKRCKDQTSPLGDFDKVADDFYEGVRCGILHQAETTKGWRIRRDGKLYNRKTINATKFLNEMEEALAFYCNTLRDSPWDDDVWQNLRKKMEAVIENCDPRAK
ncbi:MAG: hypothetical protein KatS3mg053_3933 [Candidatus Roseilinea sp.]|nr:MAG: hypothetical protein KatS3mg053_3933 [Candidatus Roseilinea sp.]